MMAQRRNSALFSYLSLFCVMLMLMLSGCSGSEEHYLQKMKDAGLEVDGKCVKIDENLFDYESVSLYNLWQVGTEAGGQENTVIMWTVNTVRAAMLENASAIYSSIADLMRGAILAAGVVMVITYFISIILGLTRFNAYMSVMVLVKLVLILVLVAPGAWESSTVTTSGYVTTTDSGAYATIVKGFFEGLVDDLSTNMVTLFSENSQVTDIFDAMDKQASSLLSMKGMVLVSALLASGGVGFIFALLLVMMIFNYLMAVLQAMKVFLVSMVLRYLLYSVGAIFLASLFFKQTKSLFTGWMEQVISFTLQPVFLFIFLGMFSSIIGGFAKNLYRSTGQEYICLREGASIAGAEIFQNWQFGKEGSGTQDVIDKKIPLNLWVIISILLVTQLMKQMTTWSVNVAQRISGGLIPATQASLPGEEPLRQLKNSVINPVQSGVKGAFGISTDGTLGGSFGPSGFAENYKKTKDKTQSDFTRSVRDLMGGK